MQMLLRGSSSKRVQAHHALDRAVAFWRERAAYQQEVALRSTLLRFSNRLGVISSSQYQCWEFVMAIRISFGLLIATSLALTAYFGTMAWRLSGDQQNDGAGWNPRIRLITAP